MDQALAAFLHGLDCLPLEYEYGQFMLHLVAPPRPSAEAPCMRGCRALLHTSTYPRTSAFLFTKKINDATLKRGHK